MTDLPEALLDVLEEHRRLGFFGPGPIDHHLRNARRFLVVLPPIRRLLDLGSGGGLPGLVLAVALPTTEVTLLDASGRRCDALRRAVRRLDLGERVNVVEGRAEVCVRQATRWEHFDAVTARSFGPPAIVAEAATGFLRIGGRLYVSEPPGAPARWPAEGLARLGLTAVPAGDGPSGPSDDGIVVLERTQPLDAGVPRRRLQSPRF